MKNNVSALRVLSKISFVFAVVISLIKILVQPEYKMLINGADLTAVQAAGLVVNVFFNIFIFVALGFVLQALALILEKYEN